MGNVLVWAIWFVAAVACLGSGLAVISFSNPFFSALALIANLASLAVLYLLLSAEFVAAAQVLVYAGAVMVMFLFVIAYVGSHADSPLARGPSSQRLAAIIAAGAILANVVVALGLTTSGRLESAADIGPNFGSPSVVGEVFLTNYLLAFEIT
jgi:NADH-quinone oxidoreductase subunit J